LFSIENQLVNCLSRVLAEEGGRDKNLNGVVDQEQVVYQAGRHNVARQPRNADVLDENQKGQETHAKHHANVVSRIALGQEVDCRKVS
jgi:hypothetical protein